MPTKMSDVFRSIAQLEEQFGSIQAFISPYREAHPEVAESPSVKGGYTGPEGTERPNVVTAELSTADYPSVGQHYNTQSNPQGNPQYDRQYGPVKYRIDDLDDTADAAPPLNRPQGGAPAEPDFSQATTRGLNEGGAPAEPDFSQATTKGLNEGGAPQTPDFSQATTRGLNEGGAPQTPEAPQAVAPDLDVGYDLSQQTIKAPNFNEDQALAQATIKAIRRPSQGGFKM